MRDSRRPEVLENSLLSIRFDSYSTVPDVKRPHTALPAAIPLLLAVRSY